MSGSPMKPEPTTKSAVLPTPRSARAVQGLLPSMAFWSVHGPVVLRSTTPALLTAHTSAGPRPHIA